MGILNLIKMATSSMAPESAVSSTTVQVSSLGNTRGPQFLIVNQGGNLHSSGGAIQIVTATSKQEKEDAIKRREILARQPSYCKILNDLKEADTSESEDREESQEQKPNIALKGETVEVVEPTHTTQTVVINGQQYQIVTPAATMEGLITTVAQSSPPPPTSVQYSTNSGLSGGGAVFLPASTQQVVTVGGQSGAISPVGALSPGGEEVASGVGVSQEQFGQQRKREIRLMKNREAARECRNKKKEYIKCLENRVAVLENQNKALIEELKSLEELYTGQKN